MLRKRCIDFICLIVVELSAWVVDVFTAAVKGEAPQGFYERPKGPEKRGVPSRKRSEGTFKHSIF